MPRKKMDSEIKQNWIDALRSGDYRQGFEHLCLEGRYCCLGVLASVLPDEEVIFEHGAVGYVDGREDKLSLRLLAKVGMTSNTQNVLMEMNDDRRMDFEDISNWIEDNL